LIPELVAALANEGAQHIHVVCGGIVPGVDHDKLLEQGVRCIFTPGTPVVECIEQVIELLQ
jgi:methylmalonyl-CoA mutase